MSWTSLWKSQTFKSCSGNTCNIYLKMFRIKRKKSKLDHVTSLLKPSIIPILLTLKVFKILHKALYKLFPSHLLWQFLLLPPFVQLCSKNEPLCYSSNAQSTLLFQGLLYYASALEHSCPKSHRVFSGTSFSRSVTKMSSPITLFKLARFSQINNTYLVLVIR